MSFIDSPPQFTAPIKGIFNLPDNTSEHTVLEIINEDRVYNIGIRVALAAITKPNFKVRIYTKIDGTNYALSSLETYGVSDKVALFERLAISADVLITVQSSIAEGSVRALPWRYSAVRQ